MLVEHHDWRAVKNHARRGVNVRTVFFANDAGTAKTMRRSAIAAYMANETSKAGQKVPPDGFGTVGLYFGTFGYRAGFKPTVDLLEVEKDVWRAMNRRLKQTGNVTQYLAVIERDGEAWGAYVPDLPGCVAVAQSREEVEKLIAEAVPLHIAAMHENGELVPAPTTVDSTRVTVTPI